MIKITVNNRKIDLDKFKEDFLIPLQEDYIDKYRKEYNEMLLEKLAESDDIIQEKYITITTFKNSISDARSFFNRICTELSTHFSKLGSKCIELNTVERLKILHDFYRNNEKIFNFDITDLAKKGHSFKECIIPKMPRFKNTYFSFENKFGRVLYLSNYPRYMKDSIVSELCNLNKNLMYSMDLISIPTDEAVKEIENKLLGVNTNITNWQRRQVANNNFSAVIPYDMELQRNECKEFLDDLIIRDQKMMLCNITIVHLADSKEELDNDTEKLYLAIQGYNFKIDYIHWALNYFGNYTKQYAQIYSDKMKNKLNLDSYGNLDYVNQVIQYIDISFGEIRLQPNFDNQLAWGDNNPYSRSKLYGQCTWFAWGRFYELYGLDPGFTGDGWDCARQLVETHPNKFKLSSIPQVGSIFSCIGKNHVGIVIGWDGKNITIQEGNLDGKTNSFYEAKKDWQTVTYDIDTFRSICDGVIFSNYLS